MSVIIDEIRILGFRGIKSLAIKLPRVTVLIGANNSGKTSFLRALHLALGDYSRHLSEEDFHIDKDEKRVSEIQIDTRIIPVDDSGNRTQLFSEEWQTEFGDKIKAEANGRQYVALRTRSKPNAIKGGFDTSRMFLENWADSSSWQTDKVKESKLGKRFLSMPFIFIDAQRDIHQELGDKSSFVGKVLSKVEYDDKEISELEALIGKVNDEAVEKSVELKSLRSHLESLNQSFQGSGNAEITPFPKKIRDLSKHFSVHFGESSGNAFSMEYHGMGTRSWASMLTAKAFIDMMAENHAAEEEPFFPILAAEEPEAHLHPGAQKTLYHQLADSKGQVIVSTHSPYLAAMAKQSELRHIKIISSEVEARQFGSDLDPEDRRRLQREVIHSRGEILFANALVLCEGETEEQALPLLFSKYFDCEPFIRGVNFIGVGGSGKKYLPFLTFAHDFNIPVFIFSDGEAKTTKELKKYYDKVYGETDIAKSPNITILDLTDFEGYLISSGFIPTLESAIKEVDGDEAIDQWIKSRHGALGRATKTDKPPCETCDQPIFEGVPRDYKSEGGYERALMDILDSGKTKFAPAVASKLCELDVDKFPPKIKELFEKMKEGISI